MKRALYFGYGRGGHWLRDTFGRSTLDPTEWGLPWTIDLLDTRLLKNRGVPDEPDGRVHWVCGGKPSLWHGFFWWDRSGDPRPACNSGFYVEGFPDWKLKTRQDAFAYACAEWPDVVSRQHHKLVLDDAPVGVL